VSENHIWWESGRQNQFHNDTLEGAVVFEASESPLAMELHGHVSDPEQL
jgi:hypothetical protein